MALILIRTDKQSKILNSLADMERYGKLKITDKPKVISAEMADNIFQGIIKENLKWKSKWAALVKVKEDNTLSITRIRKIHPPAHLVVISDEYEDYNELKKIFKELMPLKGYYSHKNRGS